MEWTRRDIARVAAIAIFMSTILVVAIFRLAGVISWPSRPIVYLLLVLMLLPVALVLIATAISDSLDDGSTSGWDWLSRVTNWFDFFS
jgi:uncharacterized membrane protein YkvI